MPGHRKRRQAGWSIRQIAADTHLGASTVHRLWRRWLEQGNLAIYRNVSATRVTSARVDRRILRQAVAAPQATCTAILQHVQDTLDHSISTRTISRRLVANGLHSCRPLRRLPLTPLNRRQRLEWCRARSTWMTEWHRVMFSDESRFCLSSDSRRVRVWRRRRERSNPAAIVERPTVRQRGIMVWGAIAYDSRSPLLRIQGTMTAQRYVDDVLRPVTLPYLQGVPNALYQQDNARPHTARISQQALQDFQMLPWPPYSPDLSPIEHVWDIIGRRLHALPQPRSEDKLWQMVEREWRVIPQDAIRTLIDSLPRRVAACIAVRVPERPSVQSQPGDKISPKERIEKNSSKEFSMEFQRNADPPARETHPSPAAARDDVTPSLAASLSYNSAARAPGNWADCAEDLRPGSDDSFTVVKSRKRRRESAGSPTAAAPNSNAGGSRTIRRPQSSAGSVPRAQEIRATRAHIAEARARQASSSEEHCVYIEHSPELEPFHYLRELDRMLGGTAGVIQITKVNGHQLLGLTNRGLAERLISEGLEVDGTLLRAFPFRKRAERITVGNLPFFVGDSAIINALSPYGRVTSIAPKQMKAGPYVYVDGRRDVFITLHEGITIERLPTRLDINIKGEAWPAYLSSGIRCSRCHGQGHRRAICPLLAGLANNTRSAPPTSSAGVLPPTTPAPPQRSATQPPAPAPSNPAMETPGASPAARAVTPSAAPRPSTPVASAVPMEMAPPAPPPKAPAPEHPASPRSAATEPTPPARPDFTTPCGPLPAQGTLGPATHTPDVDMTSTEETSASSPAAVISTLPLPAPRPAKPTPPVPHRKESAPTKVASLPALPIKTDEDRKRWLRDTFKELDHRNILRPILEWIDDDPIINSVLCYEDAWNNFHNIPRDQRRILSGFLDTVIGRARGGDQTTLDGLFKFKAAL
ncbi:hypothetical protein LAZ67_21000798 [Cordylochernes scorpioides]|uniref:Transposase n=1 Tax=Cordylochernes scorpioides TaxID=51811 RepID=A0ABY6LLY9_9ARAC|nr:hypothetical protein LAZ67_21000798 [Cordylochernes scorpioides]